MSTVLASAADERYGYHLLNLIGSVKANSDMFDAIVVYDLGLSPRQRRLVDGIRDVEVRTVPPFVPHWAQCFTWKPWIWTHLEAERSFGSTPASPSCGRSTSRSPRFGNAGYFAVSRGIPIANIIPSDYYALYDLPTTSSGRARDRGRNHRLPNEAAASTTR